MFDVDIQEDKPPLKLPYNTTDDPWMAAHDFLENNGVSQMYLDQVVKFIQEQTKGTTLGSDQPASVSDPFTGQCPSWSSLAFSQCEVGSSSFQSSHSPVLCSFSLYSFLSLCITHASLQFGISYLSVSIRSYVLITTPSSVFLSTWPDHLGVASLVF